MRKTPVTASALVLFAAVFFPLAAGAQTASEAQVQDTGLLTVVGNGTATAKPDYARLQAIARTKASTLAAAAAGHKDLIVRVGALLQSLKDKGLELASSNSSLEENYVSRDAQKEAPPPSFTAKTTYSITVANLDRLDALIAELTASGLVQVQRVSFSVRDDRPPLDEARRSAVLDGRRQAEVLAEAAGVKLSNIAEISDVRASPRDGYADLAMPLGYTLIVPPQHLDFSASMTMQWKISPRGADKE